MTLDTNPHAFRAPATLQAVLAALVLLLAGCGGAADASPGEDAHVHHAAAPSLPSPGDAAEHSVYLLPSSWKDQRGRELSLASLEGKVRVVAMVYTHCSYACPRLLALMKRIESGVVEEGRAEGVGFTLVSLDPERDTPGRLAEFAASVRLDESRWTLLTGSEGDVRALSVLLGVKYRATPDGGVDHSNLVTVLDPAGVPVYRLEGLDADPEPALRVVEELLDTMEPHEKRSIQDHGETGR